MIKRYINIITVIIVKGLIFFLPGEIGGLMGLLLGASVLTIFELLDLFFYHGAVKCALHCCRKPGSPGRRAIKIGGKLKQATYEATAM